MLNEILFIVNRLDSRPCTEHWTRENARSSVKSSCQNAHAASETMVKRYRNANHVRLNFIQISFYYLDRTSQKLVFVSTYLHMVANAVTDEISIVYYVVMRKSCTFRMTGGSLFKNHDDVRVSRYIVTGRLTDVN